MGQARKVRYPQSAAQLRPPVAGKWSNWKKAIIRDKYLYLLLLPGILFIFIFRYLPMYGVVIAFQDFKIFNFQMGIKNEWVGLLHFKRLFASPQFLRIIRNTFIISFYRIIFCFPAPLLLAILLNEINNLRFKRFTQTLVYLPHFISWVIFAGLIMRFLRADGLINDFIRAAGGKPVDFLIRKELFRPILIATDIYKNIGWGTIIYLAAFTNINPELYEAAVMDGANRFRRIIHITIPCISSVIVVLFILNIGTILNVGFQQIFLLYNPAVYEVGDIIDTYVYRKGIEQGSYSLATAAGLFKGLIALAMITVSNAVAKLLGEEGVW